MVSPLKNIVSRFMRSAKGAFAINFAVAAPMFLSLAAGVMDYTEYNRQISETQAAADAASLAAAREATVKGWTEKVAGSVALSVAQANLKMVDGATYEVDTAVDVENRRITVTIDRDHYPYFAAKAGAGAFTWLWYRE